MKKLLVLAISSFLLFTVAAQNNSPVAKDNERQAISGALDDAFSRLNRSAFGKKTIAVLPMNGRYDFLHGRIQSKLLAAGLTCVEGKNDPMWDEILKEIEWDERKDDILDATTIAKFGKLKAAQILLQCVKPEFHENTDRIYAQIELRAIDINTKEIIWTEIGVERFVIGKNVEGIVKLDQHEMDILQETIANAKASLLTPSMSAKLSNIKTVALIPICGDSDKYVTNLTLGMLAQTKLFPQNSPIPSLALVRSTIRDKKMNADAICYGALRALHKSVVSNTISGRKTLCTYELVAEVQLFIEEAKTGNVLWANEKTIAVKQFTIEKEMTAAEFEKWQKNRVGPQAVIKENLYEHVMSNWLAYLKYIALGLAGLVVLIFVVILISKTLFSNETRL